MIPAVYSPSRTLSYVSCPMLHKLSYTDGWMPRVADNSFY